MTDEITEFCDKREHAREVKAFAQAQAAERERREADPLWRLQPPGYGDVEQLRRRQDLLERARQTQVHEVALAPDCGPLVLAGGRRVERGGEIVPERDAPWFVITQLVERGVLTRIPREVAERRAAGLTSRFVVGNRGGQSTTHRGVLGPGDAISVEDFDRGPEKVEVLGEPVRIGADAQGNGVYQRNVVETRTVTAKQSREAAQRRFDELVALGYIIDKQAKAGAA